MDLLILSAACSVMFGPRLFKIDLKEVEVFQVKSDILSLPIPEPGKTVPTKGKDLQGQ